MLKLRDYGIFKQSIDMTNRFKQNLIAEVYKETKNANNENLQKIL